MKICGIDLGKSGSLALLDTDSRRLTLEPLPVLDDELDAGELFRRLLDEDVDGLIFEACFQPLPLVRSVGKAKAVGEILAVDVVECVQPSVWKRAVLGESTSNKQVSINRALELFPDGDFQPPGKRKPDHNRCEAALLAHYLMTTILNN